MTSILIQTLDEQPVQGQRLGRHIEHDERSLAYAITPDETAIATVRWTRRSPILDQGQLGACTGNAMAGAIATDSRGRTGQTGITEDTAIELYELATHLDRVPGVYPPDDTGSSGLAVAKAAQKLQYLTGYQHALGLRAALHALQSGPAIVGIAWLTGCDTPDAKGMVRYRGTVRGGHEIELIGVDADAETVTFANSWGPGWGADGYFSMGWDDFATALSNQGDVTVPAWKS